MEKRNTLLLTVIAIATLLVAVVGATFAYFANNATITNAANLTATTASSSSSFISTGAELSMNVTAGNMSQARGTAGGNLAATSTQTGHFNVTFTAGTSESLTCTYDIVYEWDATDHDYTKTSGISGDEFTYEVASSGNANFKTATQIVNGSTTGAQTIGSDSITDNHTTGGTTKEYTITTKFYNFDVDQNGNSGKTWKIKFYVTNVQC